MNRSLICGAVASLMVSVAFTTFVQADDKGPSLEDSAKYIVEKIRSLGETDAATTVDGVSGHYSEDAEIKDGVFWITQRCHDAIVTHVTVCKVEVANLVVAVSKDKKISLQAKKGTISVHLRDTLNDGTGVPAEGTFSWSSLDLPINDTDGGERLAKAINHLIELTANKPDPFK